MCQKPKLTPMKRSSLLLRFTLLFAAVLLLGQGTAFAQSGQDIIERLQNKYASFDVLKADFRQTTSSDYLDSEQQFSGTLFFKGTQYRVETESQTIVTDGTVTWIHNMTENQVLINDFVEDETTFMLNDFLFNFEDNYEIVSTGRALLGGKDHHMLRLRTKDPHAFFREVTLLMRDADDLVTRLEVVDMEETKLLFELREIVIDPPVNENTFYFVPPNGTEIIDLRS